MNLESASPIRPFRRASDYEVSSTPLLSFSRAAKVLARGTAKQVIPFLDKVPCGIEAIVLKARKCQNLELIEELEREGLYNPKGPKEIVFKTNPVKTDHYERRGLGPVYEHDD